MENDISKLSYLLLMVGHKKKLSQSSFESIPNFDISATVQMMLKPSPIVQDLYLCETSVVQEEVESTVREIYATLETNKPLDVESHLRFLEKPLARPLPQYFTGLDASHTWIIYWLLNAHLVLSGNAIPADICKQALEKINSLIVDDGLGGIAGGPNGQIGHAALTYAAVLVLALIEDYDTLARIRKNLAQWLFSLKCPDGSFAMHENGERDTRSVYSVVVVAKMLGIDTPELFAGTLDWILSCQTYEGGFAGVPGTEAHGGYTFCAVGAVFLLEGTDQLQVDLLLLWLAARQLQTEGGFSGRTNKLVDACYSYWIGAVLSMVECITKQDDLFDRGALRCYLHNCCQSSDGGLIDKPGKGPDFYHTNYSLCGLSIAEHHFRSEKNDGFSFKAEEVDECGYTLAINPVFSLPMGYAERCREHVKGLSR